MTSGNYQKIIELIKAVGADYKALKEEINNIKKSGTQSGYGLDKINELISEAETRILNKIKGGELAEDLDTSQGSSSVEVLKITVPAATNEDIDNRALCVATLPKEFQGALLIYEQYGSWNFSIGENEIGFQMQTTETEYFIVKLADLKNYTKEVTARIINGKGGSQPSDA